VNPRHSLIIALILALLDGIETYIAVFRMDAMEVMVLTRILINHYGVLGLILDDAITVALALMLYALAGLGGVVGFVSLVTLNSANALRLAVVFANAFMLLTRHDTPLSIVIVIGVVVGVILNMPLFKGECDCGRWLRRRGGSRRSVG
jgi:divalent metal cation (Fe/Co/Zn/Cd) transporter